MPGFIGRLRAMPVNLFAVPIARTVSDAVRLAAQLVVVSAAAAALLGFRPATFSRLCAALGLAVFVGWGVGWLFVALATCPSTRRGTSSTLIRRCCRWSPAASCVSASRRDRGFVPDL